MTRWFDPIQKTWSLGPAWPSYVAYHAMAVIDGHRVFVAGGISGQDFTLGQTQGFIYDSQQNIITTRK